MAVYKVNSAEQTISGITPPSPYFYSALTSVENSNSQLYGLKKIVTDSSKNIFVVYSRNDGNGGAVAKYNQNGDLQWAYNYKDAQSYYDLSDIELDSSGNIFVCGSTYQSYYARPHFMKLNSSGSIVLQKQFGSGGSQDGGGFSAITVDSSGNIYAAGRGLNASADAKPYIVKYDSTGAKLWEYHYTGASNAGYLYNIKIDSGGNIWASGTVYTGGNLQTDAFIIKLNSSGTELLQRTLSEGTNAAQVNEKNCMIIDSSDNVYVAVQSQPSSGALYTGVVVKLNSSGTLQWQRKISASTDCYPRGIAFATNGDILSLYQVTNYGQGIVSHNSSGTLQWQRKLTMKNGSISVGANDLETDSFGSMFIGVSTNGLVASSFSENGIIKIPASSSTSFSSSLLKMSLEYGAGSLTDSAGALTNTTSAIGRASITLTSSNSVSAATTINNSISKVAL